MSGVVGVCRRRLCRGVLGGGGARAAGLAFSRSARIAARSPGLRTRASSFPYLLRPTRTFEQQALLSRTDVLISAQEES